MNEKNVVIREDEKNVVWCPTCGAAFYKDSPNWEGFDLVLNRTGVTGSRTTLERSRGGFDWETVSADIRYREEGNRLHIAVPAALLGLDTASGDFTFCFKWADNTAASGDPLDHASRPDGLHLPDVPEFRG